MVLTLDADALRVLSRRAPEGVTTGTPVDPSVKAQAVARRLEEYRKMVLPRI